MFGNTKRVGRTLLTDDFALVLSYFNQRIGPCIFYRTEAQLFSRLDPDRVLILFDLKHDAEETFAYSNFDYQIISRHFAIESPFVRGGKLYFMLLYLGGSGAESFVGEMTEKAVLVEECAERLKQLNFPHEIHALEEGRAFPKSPLGACSGEFKATFLTEFRSLHRGLLSIIEHRLEERCYDAIMRFYLRNKGKIGWMERAAIKVMERLREHSNPALAKNALLLLLGLSQDVEADAYCDTGRDATTLSGADRLEMIDLLKTVSLNI